MLDEQFTNNSELYNFINRNFVAIRVFYDGSKEALEFLRKIKAMTLPSFVFMDENGVEIDRVTSYHPPPEYFLKRLTLANSGKENLKNLEDMLKNVPDNTRIMYKLGIKYHYDYDDDNKANVYFNRILENKNDAINQNVEYRRDINNPINLYEFALYLTKQYEKLIEEFSESRFSDSIYEKLSISYRDEEDISKASAFYEKATKKYPENIKIHKFYTTFAANSGSNIDNAIRSCEKIFGLSAYREAPTVRRYAELLSKKYNGAPIENILNEKYIKGNYDNPEKLFAYAFYWADKKKNLNSALEAINRAVEIDKKHYYYNTLGSVLWKNGSLNEAVNAIEKAIEIYGGSNPDYSKRIEKIKSEIKK
ncbi:hypothetical protein ACFL6G_04205 [candidate division KSB1 bacterium]